MGTVIAYVLVIPLASFCMTAGVWLGGFPIALALAWTPVSMRTKVAGFCGGVVGVAAAIAFGYGIFRLLAGPGSFSVGPFLATSLPLLIPIWNDTEKYQQVKQARSRLLQTTSEARGEATMQEVAAETETAHGSMIAGEISGLALVTLWFLSR